MTVDVYNQDSSKVEKIELTDAFFKVKWNPSLVHQVLVAQTTNKRQNLAHTKTRGEVRGGGRKPWRQKHTGRARHGSIRSPLWAGGGVTFGPRNEKKFEKKINKKMKQRALFSVLSKKITDGEFRVLDQLNLKDHKTKNLTDIIKNFFKKNVSILFVPAKENKNIFLAGRNIKNSKILSAESLNLYDCLKYKYVFLEKKAVPQIVNHYKKI